MLRRFISFVVCVAFISTVVMPPAAAQELFFPAVNTAVGLSPAFAPCVLRGIKVNARDPLRMDFLVDQGAVSLSGEKFNKESLRLVRYFLAALTIPEKDLWVNLSPYENDRIVPEDLGRTGMGRDLLAQDYILKQLTAGLLHPESDTGKTFWTEIYKRAFDTYGTTDIPVDTFNKVWITPGRSVVYEARSPDGEKISAFVDQMTLKVMLETDYVAMSRQRDIAESPAPSGDLAENSQGNEQDGRGDLARDVLRQIVIPVLEKEVNEGENFALLRQMCHSLILSVWVKKKLMASAREASAQAAAGGNVLSRVFINRNKTVGIEISQPQVQTRKIYDRYVEAFKAGAYDLIREEVDTYSQELIPRKYFAGGFNVDNAGSAMETIEGMPSLVQGDFAEVNVDLTPQDSAQGGIRAGTTMEWDLTSSQKTPRRKRSSTSTLIKFLAVPIVAMAVAGGMYFHYSRTDEAPSIPEKIVMTSRQVIAAVDTVTLKDNIYMSALIKGQAERIDGFEFFSDVLRKETPPGINEEQKKALFEAYAQEIADMVNEFYDKFASDLKAEGISAVRITQMLFAQLMRESRGDMEAVQRVGKKKDIIQGLGGLSYEYQTYMDWLNEALEEIRKYPEYDSIRLAFEREKKNPSGSYAKKRWSKADKNMAVFDVRAHLMLAVISMNKMVGEKPLPMPSIFAEMDQELARRAGIPLPDDIRDRLPDSVLSMRESVHQIAQMPEFKDLPQDQMLEFVILSSWNGGKNYTFNGLVKMFHYISLTIDERLAYQEQVNKELLEVKSEWMLAAGALEKTVPKSLKGEFNKIMKWDRNHFNGAASIVSKFKNNADARRQFFDAYWALERVTFDYMDAIETQRIWQRSVYAEITGNYTGIAGDVIKVGLEDLGKEFRALRDKSKEKVKSSAASSGVKERIVRNKVDQKTKVNKAKGKLAPERGSSGDRAEAVTDNSELGGIDLGGQDAAMDVRGSAGLFRLDLSDEQIRRLDQDLEGFLPVIMRVQPVKDVKMFLGFQNERDDARAS